MKTMAHGRKTAPWLIALGLVLVFWGPAGAGAETLKVGLPNQSLYPDPDFGSTPLASMPLGVEVEKLRSLEDWFKVAHEGKKGWMNRLAFPQLKGAAPNLPGLLSGGPVKEPVHDETALGPKGERMPPGSMEIERPVVPRPGGSHRVSSGSPNWYPDPDPAAKPLGQLPRGAEVKILAVVGDWCKVGYQGKAGWLPRHAFSRW